MDQKAANTSAIHRETPFTYKKKPKAVEQVPKKLSNQERKAQKRKWREERQIALMEAEKKKRRAAEKRAEELESIQEKKKTSGRQYTVAIALPGSILDNAQSLELRAYLGGQIARAAAVFCVDEIVIFDETVQKRQDKSEFQGLYKPGKGNTQLFHILQYLECPQYLRKDFFPYHKDLAHAGLLNPLDMPHHVRETDWSDYREGVTLNKPVSEKKEMSMAKIGLKKDVMLDMRIPPGQRVTVHVDKNSQEMKCLRGKVVSPNEPRELCGHYWGYSVRLASSLSQVFSECPHEDGGYDLTIGTSERGSDVNSEVISSFKHAIVVFGGLKGLEASVEMDERIKSPDPRNLFKHYVNVCPDQGSRTIRTEEAVLIAMACLSPKIKAANKLPAS